MKKFSHWVFDLDGTAIDSSPQYERSVVEILRDFDLVPSAEDMERAYQFFNPEEYFATFFSERSKIDEAVRKLVALNQEYASQIALFPGFTELIVFLKTKNVELSFWTGRDLASAQKILQSTGIAKHVELCVSRNCVERNKPFPDGLLKILKDLSREKADVLMVGDHEYDMQGAAAAGVQAISVGWDRRAHSRAKLLSTHHFDKLEELHAWAKGIYD